MRATAPVALTLGDAPGKWVIAAAVLGSGMAGVDATVVNIALPALGRDLHAGFDGMQWTINMWNSPRCPSHCVTCVQL